MSNLITVLALVVIASLAPSAEQENQSTLSQTLKPELVVQTGHSSWITSVAFSPDGQIIATSSDGDDYTAKLWNVATGTELRTLTGQKNYVRKVVFSPDGTILATLASDGTKLWDVGSGRELRTLKRPEGKRPEGKLDLGEWCISFGRDGRTLASGGGDNDVRLWDTKTGEILRLFAGHSAEVNYLAFSPDGRTLATGSRDNTIKLWDVLSGRELRTLTGHSDQVQSVAFSLDGKTLASGSSDKTIKLWDMTGGRELRTLTGHADEVLSALFSPDGQTIVSKAGDYSIIFWAVSTGAKLRTIQTKTGGGLALSPDGKHLASGNGYKTITLWDASSAQELRTFQGHTDSLYSLTFIANENSIASADLWSSIRLWDISTGIGLPKKSRRSLGKINSIAFSADGTKLVAASGSLMRLEEVLTGNELGRKVTNISAIAQINSAAISPNGTTMATSSLDKTLTLWDITTGTKISTFKTLEPVGALAFAPDGATLAVGFWNCGLILLSGAPDQSRILDPGISERRLSHCVTSLAFSPDGKALASGSNNDKTIKIWDVGNSQRLLTLRGHSNWIYSLAFSPDGKTLASASHDKTIRLWNVNSGTELYVLAGHSEEIHSVMFSADSKLVASASFDGTVRLWNVSDGSELAALTALDDKDWLVSTPDGLFDGSAAAWDRVLWRFNNNTFDHAPVEAFFNEYYYPGLLADIFAGKRPKAPSDIAQKDRRQPQLKLTLNGSQAVASSAERNVTVKIDVSQAPAGAQDVRLFRNGSLVKVWRGDVLQGKSSVTLETTIPIVAGENRLTAYAFNHDNIKSNDSELLVKGADSLKRQGTAYILAIGVNNYANAHYNLKYAVADAEGFATEVKRQQESLKRYGKVEIISLADAQATKANIAEKLSDLAKQVQPEDAVIVFFAGHGTASGNQFYLIPHDLGYDGPRDNLNEPGLQKILAHSVSDRELERLFEPIDAGQLLLVIDACNSGQALEAEEKRRGPMNSKGLAQLAYEKGMYVLTASQSYQAAQEAAKFGHGFLTYALVEEGLKHGAADREPKNGSIDIREWLNFATDEVPKMQENNSREALRGRGRFIPFGGDGYLGIPKTETGARDNVQRPRVFFRRELEANPLVIAAVSAGTPK